MMNNTPFDSGRGYWIYRMPEQEHGSYVRDRYQFIQSLTGAGVPVVVATGNGLAHRNIMTDAAVVPWSEQLLESPRLAGVLVGRRRDLPAKKKSSLRWIVHDLGHDAARSSDTESGIEVLGRDTCDAHISRFFLTGFSRKNPRRVVIIYRDNPVPMARCIAENPSACVAILPADPHELEWAEAARQASWCVVMDRIASPRVCVEAMAAGCVVLALPECAGGFAEHAVNAWLVDETDMPGALNWIMQPGQRQLAARLRCAGLATAWQHAEAIP